MGGTSPVIIHFGWILPQIKSIQLLGYFHDLGTPHVLEQVVRDDFCCGFWGLQN
jgi:hypothetical protein